jgi:hypothetical protein
LQYEKSRIAFAVTCRGVASPGEATPRNSVGLAA